MPDARRLVPAHEPDDPGHRDHSLVGLWFGGKLVHVQ